MSLSKSASPTNKANSNLDLILIAIVTISTYFIAGYFELAEAWLSWAKNKESYQLDEMIFVLLVLSICLMWFSHRRNKELQITLEKNLSISASLEKKNIEIITLLAQNRELIKHITHVRETERNELAGELHDVFGQHLAAIDVNATVASKYTKDDEKLNGIIETIRTSALILINVTRAQLRSIKPPSLQTMGLSNSIDDLINQWQASFTNYVVTVSIDVDDQSVNDEIALTVYRALQEGLSNIVKHAQAQHIAIILETRVNQDHGKTILHLSLQDDGLGADPETCLGKGLGLIGMRERITALSGQFNIIPIKPHGTQLLIEIPLHT